MPTRAENKAKYPKDWAAISARIRARAGNCCEECGVSNGQLGGRLPDGQWAPALPTGENGLQLTWPQPGEHAWCEGGYKLRIVRIVLTTAHLDHEPSNCTDENLKSLCQCCHNRYDMATRRRGIQERARQQKAVGDLFTGEKK